MRFGNIEYKLARMWVSVRVYFKDKFASQPDVIRLVAEHYEEVHTCTFFRLTSQNEVSVWHFIASKNFINCASFLLCDVARQAISNLWFFLVIYADNLVVINFRR